MYYSQYGQDEYLHQQFFADKKDGVFVEIGAHDGVKFSNTLFFEKQGWRGLCVEPIFERFQELEKNRNCHCVHGVAFNRKGNVQFKQVSGYAEMLSGITYEYDPRHKQRIERETKHHGGEVKTILVPSYRLETLLDKYNMTHIDYMSIDTEGSELGVLHGINFRKVQIDVIGIEENYPDTFTPIQTFLQHRGYRLHTKIGCDCIFVLKQK